VYYAALTFFIIVAVSFVAGNIKIAYLLYNLGFNFEVVKFLILEAIMLIFSIIIVHGLNYSTSGFCLSGILLGCIVPTIFISTKKKVDPKQRKTKPKYMSQQEWNWRHYEIGRSEWVDGGYGSW